MTQTKINLNDQAMGKLPLANVDIDILNLGYAINLPNFSDFGAVSNNALTNNLPNFSASCWINTDQFISGPTDSYAIGIMGNVNLSTDDGGWIIQIYHNGQIYNNIFAPGASAQYATLGTKKVNDGVWHHILVTYDSTIGFVTYIDGILDPISNIPGPLIPNFITSNNFHIGAFPPNNPNNPSIATIANVQLWNTTLVNTDASTLAQGGTVAASSVAKWSFTEGTGLTAADSVGGNTLTFTNVIWAPPLIINNTTLAFDANSILTSSGTGQVLINSKGNVLTA